MIQTTLKKVPVKVVVQNNTVVGGSGFAATGNFGHIINTNNTQQFI